MTVGAEPSRFMLGTAQFGLDYGISNRDGRVDAAEVGRILEVAHAARIDALDTAQVYGNSEAVLGSVDPAWSIYTKLPSVPEDILDDTARIRRWVTEGVQGSLARLRRGRLSGLMLHDPRQLGGRGGAAIFAALREQVDEGRTETLGISIYGPDDLDILPNDMTFDFIQAPYNVLDRRLADSGWLARLSEAGCKVFARSAFLQGLLLMKVEDRPSAFQRWQALWQAWEDYLRDNRITALEACLRFVVAERPIDRIVVGVTSAAQLSEILVAAEGDLPPLPPILRTAGDLLVNPSKWAGL